MRDEAELHTLGNRELLGLHKVAFLCSRRCPPEVEAKARDWALLQCREGVCVISGFHSPIEKEVLHYLLTGTQPVIVALAKGIGKRVAPELEPGLETGRLLIVTRYADSVTHACEESCYQRNRLMMRLADESVVAYASPGGSLERLCRDGDPLCITRL